MEDRRGGRGVMVMVLMVVVMMAAGGLVGVAAARRCKGRMLHFSMQISASGAGWRAQAKVGMGVGGGAAGRHELLMLFLFQNFQLLALRPIITPITPPHAAVAVVPIHERDTRRQSRL